LQIRKGKEQPENKNKKHMGDSLFFGNDEMMKLYSRARKPKCGNVSLSLSLSLSLSNKTQLTSKFSGRKMEKFSVKKSGKNRLKFILFVSKFSLKLICCLTRGSKYISKLVLIFESANKKGYFFSSRMKKMEEFVFSRCRSK
jgi:hypothetical protein